MKRSIILGLILSSIQSIAQVEPSNQVLNQKPFIEVVGTASKEVVPDKIFISIVLSDKVAGNEKYTIEEQEQQLKKSLTSLGIDLANLSLSDLSSEITRDKKRETGLRITKEFILELKSSGEVSKVFKELYAINIKESSILKTESSMIESLRKEVRIAAIKAAKEKADYLLAAIGEKIDKPLEIREQQDIFPGFRDNTAVNAILGYNNTDAGQTEPSFQKFTIRFSYYIKYSIK